MFFFKCNDLAMKLKTNLHFHTADDPQDNISYTLEEGIDHAASLGFEVIALTCHASVQWRPSYAEYAASKNILLISGIEANIGERPGEKRHLLILNCDKSAEKIKNFADLAEYKKNHSEIFVIASHPYFPGDTTLKKYLEKYIHLMDGIEHSWFYSKGFNLNKKAERIARHYNLPFIATSDTHFFTHMNTDYTVIDAEKKSPEAIFKALRQHQFSNATSPKRLVWDMIIPFTVSWLKNRFTTKK